MSGARPVGDTGLYVHVPFCARACPYCDFDFQVVGRAPDRDVLVEGLLAGLAREVVARGVQGLRVRTLYIGGGTPSVLGARGLAALLAKLRGWVALGDCAETTVELNPEHIDAVMLDALAAGGCTRVSIGAQSLDRAGLVQLGRMHRPDAALRAVAMARDRGLAVSADLIVGWPGQPPDAAAAELAAFEAAGARHLSIYALTVEPGTPWERLVAGGKRQMPDDDHQARLLAAVDAWAQGRAWEHYEVASYAADAADRARHNAGYWTGVDYVGLGPSAASAHYAADGTVMRRTNVAGFARWSADPGQAPGYAETLDPHAAAVEGLWLGLRLLGGVSVGDYLRRHPAVDRAWLRRRLQRCVRDGDVVWSDADRLALSPGRWLVADAVAAKLL